MSIFIEERPAVEALRSALTDSRFGCYDGRSYTRDRVRHASIALADEARRRNAWAGTLANEIRAVAADVGLEPMSPPASDAVRWCLARYFHAPLHD